MAGGGYLGNVYNDYASGTNFIKLGSNIVDNETFKKEEFADNQDLANLFGMLGILIALVIIVVFGYKFFVKTQKH